jgi:N-acetylmuramoyl-L-alanine amidase
MAGCTLKRLNSLAKVVPALAALVLSVSAAAQSSKPVSKVTAIRFWSLGELTRVSIEVNSDFKYYAERVPNPDRIFFDIKGARPAMAEKTMHVMPVGDDLVRQIRVAETTPGVTRVVLDLEEHTPLAEYSTSQLANPNRLVIEVRLKDPAPPVTSSVTGAKTVKSTPVAPVEPDLIARAAPPALSTLQVAAPPKKQPREFVPPPHHEATPFSPAKPDFISSASIPILGPTLGVTRPRLLGTPKRPIEQVDQLHLAPAPKLPTERAESISDPPEPVAVPKSAVLAKATPIVSSPPIPVAQPTPAKRNASGERSLTRTLGLKLGTIVLDPGHGGQDVGTVGPTGYYEKNLVLDVSLRLGALLKDRLGSEVVFTREDDSFIPLEQRTKIANDHKADLFLSIHANSSTVRSVSGVESYYLNFSTSRTALDLASRENAGSGHTVFDLKELIQKIALKDKIEESHEFATHIQNSLYSVSAKSNAAAQNRGLKRAPFVVLIGASMPSVLAEIGFLTNPADEAMLRTEDHRQKIAEALYKGIASYVETLSHFQVAQSR